MATERHMTCCRPPAMGAAKHVARCEQAVGRQEVESEPCRTFGSPRASSSRRKLSYWDVKSLSSRPHPRPSPAPRPRPNVPLRELALWLGPEPRNRVSECQGASQSGAVALCWKGFGENGAAALVLGYIASPDSPPHAHGSLPTIGDPCFESAS